MRATFSTLPPGLRAASQLGKLLLTESSLTYLNFSFSVILFFLNVSHYLFLHFNVSSILSHLTLCDVALLECRAAPDFAKRVFLKKQQHISYKMWRKKKTPQREKRVSAGKAKKKKGEDISTSESTT